MKPGRMVSLPPAAVAGIGCRGIGFDDADALAELQAALQPALRVRMLPPLYWETRA
jgi:hypothetical protein